MVAKVRREFFDPAYLHHQSRLKSFPVSGCGSKKDFTSSNNVVRILVFAAYGLNLTSISSKIKTDLKRLCPLRLEA